MYNMFVQLGGIVHANIVRGPLPDRGLYPQIKC